MKKNASGGKTIYIKAPNPSQGKFVLPEMKSPFGLSSFTDAKTSKVSYSLDLSIDNPELTVFFRELESRVVDNVLAHSEEYLGKVYSREVAMEALFKSAIREGKEPGKYNPTIKLKIMTDNKGDFVPKCYDVNRKQIDLNEITKGQRIKTIVELGSIWIVDNKFGVTVRLVQGMMMPKDVLTECAFPEDDVVEDDADVEV